MIASSPISELFQKVSTSLAPGSTAAMPTMATAAGLGSGPRLRCGRRAQLLDPRCRAGCDVLVQITNRHYPVKQGRNLAEHVQAVG